MSLFRSIFKYVWPQMRKYKLAFWLVLILFTLRVIFDAILKPIYFKKIIDLISGTIVDKQALSHDLYKILVSIIILSVLVVIVARVGKFFMYHFQIKVTKEIRDFYFKKITSHSQTFFANTFSGSLVTKARRFTGAFETMFDIFIYELLGTGVSLIAVFFVISKESVVILWFFIVWIVLFLSLVIFFVNRKIKYDLIEAAADSRIGGRMADVFGNILAVKIFSAQEDETVSFGKVSSDAAEKSSQTWNYFLKIEIIQSVLIVVVQSILLYLLISLWINNKITTGSVVLIQTYTVFLFERLWHLSNSLTRFMKMAADMKESIDIFEIKSDILDPVKPEEIKMDKGHLVFNNICFKYKSGQDVFKNFNLDIKSGERVGLVGHSGAGKSTFTNLILRFTDVDSGSITIDGQDIRNVLQDDLRSVVSYVPQESVLFHRTIKENIAYGKPDATDNEIIAIAKKAHAHDFIEKLPNKYDTFVGERGVKLSGGERQRVSIARAMLKNSPILILDEATSALDSVSEQYIQEALNELMKGKTTIVIAHRLSTIQKMDRIIVLEEGDIVEEGTHKELIEKEGVYADLWNHQVGGFIE